MRGVSENCDAIVAPEGGCDADPRALHVWVVRRVVKGDWWLVVDCSWLRGGCQGGLAEPRGGCLRRHDVSLFIRLCVAELL